MIDDLNAARNILAKGVDAAGKAPEAENARGGPNKTRRCAAAHSPAKRESDRDDHSPHPVASGATPDRPARAPGRWEAEVLHNANRIVGVNALLLMALRLVARLVAEAHGFDEFGEELERERQK